MNTRSSPGAAFCGGDDSGRYTTLSIPLPDMTALFFLWLPPVYFICSFASLDRSSQLAALCLRVDVLTRRWGPWYQIRSLLGLLTASHQLLQWNHPPASPCPACLPWPTHAARLSLTALLQPTVHPTHSKKRL